ncbi:replicative DNA helicase [Fibrobacterales bacterium]|nr:replicative DNA helicase [Fibrobacterales bacterium]
MESPPEQPPFEDYGPIPEESGSEPYIPEPDFQPPTATYSKPEKKGKGNWDKKKEAPLRPLGNGINPSAPASERYVIGAVLQDRAVLDEAIRLVRSGEFYDPRHVAIWDAISKLNLSAQPVDFSTVTEALNQMNRLHEAGGRPYIASIIEEILSTASTEFHSAVIREKALLRALIKESGKIIFDAQDPSADPLEVLSSAEKHISMLSQQRLTDSNRILGDVLQIVMEEMQNIEKGAIAGLQTGFTELDNLTSGLHGGELIILAGRPGMGKTAFALSLIANSAIKFRKNAVFFSLEMGAEQLVMRILCSQAAVDMGNFKRGMLHESEISSIQETLQTIHDAPLYIDDQPGLTMLDMKSKCRTLNNQLRNRGSGDGLDLIIVDYLQLMSGDSKEGRQNEVSGISRGLKELAKELKVPLIALSQLSRKVEERGSEDGAKRPMLSDLRESGSIEQDADMVWFVYRDAYYNKELRDNGGQDAELMVAKHRNGEIKDVPLTFIGKQTAFVNRQESAGSQDYY